MPGSEKNYLKASKLHPCEVCGWRVMANSVLCTKFNKSIQGRCANIKRDGTKMAMHFVSSRCMTGFLKLFLITHYLFLFYNTTYHWVLNVLFCSNEPVFTTTTPMNTQFNVRNAIVSLLHQLVNLGYNLTNSLNLTHWKSCLSSVK